MKNLFKLLLCSVVAIVALGCEGAEVDSDRIATPTITCSVNENTITVTWGAVAGAAYYEIALDNAEATRTDKLAHKFEGLKYDNEYTIKLQAVATDSSKSSEVATKKVTIGKRVVPAYREWYPLNNAAATAISNNGRYVVGGYDRQGMIIDLTTDEITLVENFEFTDVSDNGEGVGIYYGESQGGEAAMYINGHISKIDLSGLTSSDMSALESITPDGEYVVGWWWEANEDAYYHSQYGFSVPFCYDIIKDRITVPSIGESPYAINAVSAHGVTPDRRIIGFEQSDVHIAVVWPDEYTPYTYPAFEYDSEYKPTLTFGDNNSRFSAQGNYICGMIKTFAAGETQQPAVYDCINNELITMTGIGASTCVTDEGIAFLNDVPNGPGTTSYIVDLNGDREKQIPIIDWMLDEHGIDLYSYIKEGVITIGASEDGRTLLGIAMTESGWLTYVISLDGEAMPEI